MQNGGQKDKFIVLTCNSTNARMESLQNCIKCKPMMFNGLLHVFFNPKR
jgi:hypothetical protein